MDLIQYNFAAAAFAPLVLGWRLAQCFCIFAM